MPPFDTEVPALLLRLDPNPFHHGTLGAIRSLGRTGIEVHLAQAAPGPVDRSRFVHRVHSLPPGGTSEAEIERALCRVSDAIGRTAVLIALDDRGAIAVAALAERLRGRFLLPDTAPDLPAQVADKAELAGLCSAAGISHPVTVAPESGGSAAHEAALLGLPAVAKWSRPWLLPKGMRSTTLVRTPADARELYEQSDRAGSRLLLQQRLAPGRGTDWFFHGYADGDGGFLMGGAGRKERSWPPRTGLTAVGTWLANPEVEKAAARLTALIRYRGILDLDFRLDPATGSYHLLDFNPRPGAQFRLFTDEGGLDVVRAQHLHLTGRPVPGQSGGPGRVFVAENYALLSALVAGASLLGPRRRERERQRGGGRPAGGGRRTVERAWFAADDPRPFFAMAGAWSVRGALKIWRLAGSAGSAALSVMAQRQPSAPQFRTTRDERSVEDQREGSTCTTS
jgi:predicted ATP-grasp superfamily ATP-dependent carboligase